MNIRRICLALMLACLGVALAGCSAFQRSRDKVVLQVSDNDSSRWNLALNNAHNAQEALAGAVDIKIVVYGPGINMLRANAPTAARVSAAVQSGVQIVACENTMTAQKLTKADMNPDIGYVPTGVLELMARQKEGWAYIRP